jgi:hypothetical protein
MGRFAKAGVAIDGSKFEAVNKWRRRGDGQARGLKICRWRGLRRIPGGAERPVRAARVSGRDAEQSDTTA